MPDHDTKMREQAKAVRLPVDVARQLSSRPNLVPSLRLLSNSRSFNKGISCMVTQLLIYKTAVPVSNARHGTCSVEACWSRCRHGSRCPAARSSRGVASAVDCKRLKALPAEKLHALASCRDELELIYLHLQSLAQLQRRQGPPRSAAPPVLVISRPAANRPARQPTKAARQAKPSKPSKPRKPGKQTRPTQRRRRTTLLLMQVPSSARTAGPRGSWQKAWG